MSGILGFLRGCARLVARGNRAYYAWLGVLAAAILIGLLAYAHQFRTGLIATNMRDQVSWAFYVGNFTFLVGVAAAAVLLVIPAYVYEWEPIKEVVILGELLAVSAITMCLLFILVDMGRPDRFLHILPLLGSPNWPHSMLTWDALVLNGYLALNLTVVVHILYKGYRGEHYNRKLIVPLVLASIPGAVSIHTVTAFLYNGMAARPFWNASILAPRFIASAFCSGPAVMIILFQILRKTTRIAVKDEAIFKVAELMAYAMFVNLFLLGAEVFKEYYSATEHLLYTQYLWSGIGPHRALVPFAWLALACSVSAFLLFLVPRTRRNFVTLNAGCVLIWAGVYIEKGMGLVIPGMTPDTLGEIYEYRPTATEWAIAAGIFGVGFLVFTVLVKVAVPIMTGTFQAPDRAADHPSPGKSAAVA
ncbi:sulfate reduction electron transfer complex DsrMKJOP subunit DsrP [Anaeromyxobacter diazotrophicus]|uniref:Hdr menaquinol oxidoreductase integral membrane subunit n=1 Tax=Anaeromyxobacter diazotrophicus TaxID=2590199 RepID=A0A7I9VLL1_9BACT|nr:NrfD/PsrC family molybdoenzyme membrane anchor subunit [Anaeromyxobacter diazotrophicus]GEJ56877.1 Hdr menaquinol oxidoreductase integral membrane subunit [Anaeromyxobacter diazotrophicus]